MDFDEKSLGSAPTMVGGTDGGAGRPSEPQDYVSLGSAPTMAGGASRPGEPPSLGQIDQYQLVRKLGGGGFGVVYLARDTVSGVDVALKTLHPLLKSNPEEMEALRAKFALVSRLSHPNIASPLVLHPCRDIDITDDAARREMRLSPGVSVMVMRYAPGVTLSKWRRQFPDGVVPLDQALEVVRQVASALDYAHGEKIVHRDIKPANVMVETLPSEASRPSRVEKLRVEKLKGDGGASSPGEPQLTTNHFALATSKIRVRILDFGLAAEIRSSMSRISTETGDTSGTRPYMAPEQWLGRKQDGRTDQDALACVAYELLSGAPPFEGAFETGDPVIMMAMVKGEAPEEIEGVPAHVNAALVKALAKNQSDRFSNCYAFAEALSNQSGETISAIESRPLPRSRVWPWAAALVAAFAVGVVLWRNGGTGAIGATGVTEVAPRSSVPSVAAVQETPGKPAPPDSQEPPAESTPPVEPVPETSGNLTHQEILESPASSEPPTLPPEDASPESPALPEPPAPALPPDGASLEDHQAARDRFSDALEARRAEGWPDDSAESAPLAELIATLDGRITSALKEREEQERQNERERIEKRASDARAVAAIGRLKAAAAREVRGVEEFRKWDDGEFKTQFALLDRQKAALDSFSEASDLAKAKEAAADIHSAAVWIADNAEAREGLDAIEKAIDALSPELEKAEAQRYAQSALYAANTARKEAVRRRDRSDFTGAKEKFEEAKRLFDGALAEARRTQVSARAREAVGEAEAAKIREEWETVIAKANAALALDADNADAKSLKAEAEAKLAAIKAELERKASETAHKGRASSPDDPLISTIDLGGGVSLEMVYCPGVSSDFWMGKYEVTQEQWERVMGNNPSFLKETKNPVDCVSWNDCQEFIRKLNALPVARASGLIFRLPTEQEWETACRAGAPQSADYCKLEDGTQITASTLSRVARYGKSRDDGTVKVGSFEPNAWGLYDMHGNVLEWTETASGGLRVYCGGSFLDGAEDCTAGNRFGYFPGLSLRDLGFRLAASGRAAIVSSKPEAPVPLGDSRCALQSMMGDKAGERKVIQVGSQEIALRWCPPGPFTMGSPTTEEGRDSDETQHRVTLTKGFWMGETEVTQGLWKSLMDGETVIDLARKALQDDTEYNIGGKMQTLRAWYGRSRDADPQGICADPDDNAPVYHVSWNDAVLFCQRLTRREREAGRIPDGYEYRLPTEAEWEYACRAGTTTSLPSGREIRILGENNAPALDDIAWYGGNSSVGFEGRGWDTENWKEKQHPGGRAGPRRVGMKGANAWGLYDMIGNVYEWCADWYGDYPSGTVTDPVGPSSGSYRVCRGGSWCFNARICRSANRYGHDPGCRFDLLGFRVALSPVQEMADAVH